MAIKDFVVKNGLQVQSNVVVGAYTGRVLPLTNGMLVSGDVGIGTSTVRSGDKITIAGGNIKVNTLGSGIVYPDGTFQTTAATGASISVSNDVTTDASTYYPSLTNNVTSGTLSALVTSSTKLFYNPSSGGLNSGSFIPNGNTAPINGMFLPATNSIGFATNGTEKVRIDPLGNMGIGTNVPNAWGQGNGTLTIAGDGNSELDFKIRGADQGWIYANGAAFAIRGIGVPLSLGVDNEQVVINTSGNMGVGTSYILDGNKVSVYGGNLQVGTTGTGIVFPDGTFQTTAPNYSQANGGTGAVQYANGTAFAGDNTKFFYDSVNYRLAIGNNDVSSSTLNVSGGLPTLLNTLNGSDPTLVVGASTASGAIIGSNTSGGYGYARSTLSGNDMLRWNGTGVGINGVTPANTLDVSGKVIIGSGASYAGNGSAPTNGLMVQGAIVTGTATAPSAGIQLQVGGTGASIFSSNVGIGTSSTTGMSVGNVSAIFGNEQIMGSLYVQGNINNATWRGQTISEPYGGTNQTSYVAGDTLYASATNTLSKLSIGSTDNILKVSGGIPSWGTINLASSSAVGTSILGLTNGGTNASLTASNGGIVYSNASQMQILAASANSGNVLISGGAGAPSWGQYYTALNVPSSIVSRDSSGNFAAGTITAATGLTVTSGGFSVTGNSILTGNLTVSGNLMITGNINTVSSNVLVVNDPIIYVGENNPGNAFDLGIVGSYNTGTYQHTGVVRNRTTGQWTIFDNLATEPTQTIDWANASFGGFKAGNVEIAGGVVSLGTTTGSIVINGLGGLGVGGAINAGGQIATSGGLNVNGAAIVGSLTSNAAISATGFEGGYVSGTVFNARTSLIAGTVASNGAISGTTITGTAATVTSLQSSGTATVNALVSNGAISGTTINGTAATLTSLQSSGTATVQSLVSNGAISGTTITGSGGLYATAINTGGTATVNSLVSNGAISGTTINGTAATLTSLQSSGTATVASLVSNGAISGTTINGTSATVTSLQSSGTATVNALVSNGAISGTTINGTAATVTSLQSSGTATVQSLVSNGAISGTTINGTAATVTSLQSSGTATVASLVSNGTVSGTAATFTSLQSSGTATVASLVSNGTVSGTAATFTSLQSSGTATVNALVSNGAVSGTTATFSGTATVNALVSNGAVSGTAATFTSLQSSGTATVNALVSNGAISGTTITGTAATLTSLQSSGTATVNALTSNTTVTSNSFVLSGTVDQGLIYTSAAATLQTIDSFSATTYRAAEYQISITSSTTYEITKLTVIHDGSSAYVVEYDVATTAGILATFDASISGGTVNLQATPANAATTFKIYRRMWTI